MLAWFAAHMLATQPLSDRWAPADATIAAVGGQTARPIDDIGALISVGGHLFIQAKTPPSRSGQIGEQELAVF